MHHSYEHANNSLSSIPMLERKDRRMVEHRWKLVEGTQGGSGKGDLGEVQRVLLQSLIVVHGLPQSFIVVHGLAQSLIVVHGLA